MIIAPSWQRENSISPPEYDAAMPSALTIFLVIESQEPACGDGAAKSTGQAGRVKTSSLERIPRGDADARHHFAGGDKSGEQRFAIGFRFLRHREGWEKSRRAGMDARARLAHVVELESVSHDTVGECRLRRLRREIFSDHGGAAAQARSRERIRSPMRLHGFVEPYKDTASDV